MQPSPHDVPGLVDRWVAAGIITPDQAARIRADLATLPRPVSLVAEGLGYLGGVIVVVGLGLVLNLSWDRLAPPGRVGVAAGIALALVVAGVFVPTGRLGAAGKRLRGVLWAGASVAVFAAIVLLADEILHWSTEDNSIILLAGAGTAVVSAVLWALNRHVLQHLAVVVSTAIGVGAGAELTSDDYFLTYLAVWGLGVIWFVLSLPNIIPQASGGVLGAITATTGALLMIDDEAGPLLALGTAVALVATGVARRQLPILGVGSVGTLIALPFVVDKYFPGELQVALSLVLAGLALVAVAIFTARRRKETPAA